MTDNINSTLFTALRECLAEQKELDTQEFGLVKALRSKGATWNEIAEIYEVSRQAVHSKWAAKVNETLAPKPPKKNTLGPFVEVDPADVPDHVTEMLDWMDRNV